MLQRTFPCEYHPGKAISKIIGVKQIPKAHGVYFSTLPAEPEQRYPIKIAKAAVYSALMRAVAGFENALPQQTSVK